MTAVVFLMLGGLMGLMVALTRWPAVQLLPAEWFYLMLTGHGANVLLFWILFFEIAILYFASAVLLGARLAAPKFAWLAFILMIVGALMANYAVLRGDSSVMFTSYPPMMASHWFYLSLIIFAVGALLAVIIFFATLVVAKAEKTYDGSVPLVTFGAITAAIIAVFTLASGAIILIPTWLWSLGLISGIDTLMYKVDLVGHGPFQPADQRLGPRGDLVRHRGDGTGRQAAERKGQPDGVLHVHPVPAAGLGAPPAGRAGSELDLEDRQHHRT